MMRQARPSLAPTHRLLPLAGKQNIAASSGMRAFSGRWRLVLMQSTAFELGWLRHTDADDKAVVQAALGKFLAHATLFSLSHNA